MRPRVAPLLPSKERARSSLSAEPGRRGWGQREIPFSERSYSTACNDASTANHTREHLTFTQSPWAPDMGELAVPWSNWMLKDFGPSAFSLRWPKRKRPPLIRLSAQRKLCKEKAHPEVATPLERGRDMQIRRGVRVRARAGMPGAPRSWNS
ncbi:hypothetical protein ACRRTK_000228 [Alexandromys fortis]